MISDTARHNWVSPAQFRDAVSILGRELIHALRNPSPESPYAHIGDAQTKALEQLAEILNAPQSNHNSRFPQWHKNSYLSHHQGWPHHFQGWQYLPSQGHQMYHPSWRWNRTKRELLHPHQASQITGWILFHQIHPHLQGCNKETANKMQQTRFLSSWWHHLSSHQITINTNSTIDNINNQQWVSCGMLTPPNIYITWNQMQF